MVVASPGGPAPALTRPSLRVATFTEPYSRPCSHTVPLPPADGPHRLGSAVLSPCPTECTPPSSSCARGPGQRGRGGRPWAVTAFDCVGVDTRVPAHVPGLASGTRPEEHDQRAERNSPRASATTARARFPSTLYSQFTSKSLQPLIAVSRLPPPPRASGSPLPLTSTLTQTLTRGHAHASLHPRAVHSAASNLPHHDLAPRRTLFADFR